MLRDYRHVITFNIPFDEIDWDDADTDDGRGGLTVEINGVGHHLMFIPVKVDAKEVQVGVTRYAEQDLVGLQSLYGLNEGFQTIKIPGRKGTYLVYMHPFGD